MKDLAIKISEALYKWVLSAPGHAEYHKVYDNSMTGGLGMMYTFIFLLVISICAAAIYYFVVSNTNVANATKKNYLTFYVLGLITLIVVTVVGLRLISGYNGPEYWSDNLLKINLVNLLWYTLFFEVWSLLFKSPVSKSTHHLLSKD